MALITSWSTKFASNITQELHNHGRNNVTASTRNLRAKTGGRREFLLSLSSTTSTLIAVAAATDQIIDSRTAILQKYLKKSEENKAKNDKERLDDYYKRNYKDYFGFVEGSLRAKEDGQLSESEKGILEWLEKNK